ncbi:MAG: hypothetical protein GY847_38870 [Proteobacteria bacterium]|nr:hypothetical protein [Pseudomonadota bacterium]
MKFDNLASLVRKLEWFDLQMVVQLTGERRETITNQLYRFSKAGKVIPLRRGLYVLADPYRKASVQPASLANAIYRPSYLTGMWALSYYGMIPESVPVFTSVTTRTPREFENHFGTFRYRNIKRSMFFGYTPSDIFGKKVLVATPEKALVDFLYLSRGEWTKERMREMRFLENTEIDRDVLFAAVRRSGKPRLQRALEIWQREMTEQEEGMVEL